MTDLGFVIAGYGVILGSVAAYAVILARRIHVARDASLRIRRDAESAALPRDGG